MNILRNLYLLIFFVTVTSATDIVILRDIQDSSSFCDNVAKYSSYYSTSITDVKDKKDIISAINNISPELFIFRSDRVYNLLSDMSSTVDINIPFIKVGSSKGSLDSSNIYIEYMVSPEVAINGLSQFTGKSITSLGYIYSSSQLELAKNEISNIKNDHLEITEREVSDQPTVDEIVYGINKLNNRGISTFRIFESGTVIDNIDSSELVSNFVEKYASSIISNSSVFSNKKFSKTPIIIIRENRELTAAATALIATYRIKIGAKNSKKSNYSINTTVASVSIGAVKKFTLSRSHKDLFSYITDEIIEIGDTSYVSWGDIKKFPFISEINEIIEVSTKKSAGRSFLSFLKEFFKSKLYEVLSNMFLVIFLILAPILFFINKRRKKRYNRRSILLFTKSLEKCKIDIGDSEITLKKILKSEAITSISLDTIEQLQKQLRKFIPEIFIVDLSIGKGSLKLIKNELKDYSLSAAETVIIVNAPENFKESADAYFSNAEVLVFHKMPDEFDLIDAINGRYQGSSKIEKSEFISGAINGDNLTEILQLLEGGNKNGALIVEDKSPLSVIYYKDGRIVFAEDRFGNRGESAIYNGLNCKKGSYSFMLNRKAPTTSFSFGAMEILLEFAAASDHRNMA